MTDRELLKLAAQAAGIRIDKSETNGGGVGNDGFCVTGDAMLDWHNNIRWNPLTDDGDALRLAVKLGIRLEFADGWVVANAGGVCAPQFSERTGSDAGTATRRAIVRAAAEIGRTMATTA